MRLPFMKITFRSITVYVDEMNNILAVPIGKSKKYGEAGLDIVNQLNVPYTDEEVEATLVRTLNQCYSKKCDDELPVTPLEKFLNIKGYAKAVKNKKVIMFEWNHKEGYSLIPTNKIPKRGFVFMQDQIIKLGKVLKPGQLATAFKEAVNIAITD